VGGDGALYSMYTAYKRWRVWAHHGHHCDVALTAPDLHQLAPTGAWCEVIARAGSGKTQPPVGAPRHPDQCLTISFDRTCAVCCRALVTSNISGSPQRVRKRALQTPEQRPEGPRPAQVPLPRNCWNCPVPWAVRGPATTFISACPDPETRPPNRIG
jgi:hypothetical protein